MTYEALGEAVRIAFGEQALATRKLAEYVLLRMVRPLTENEELGLGRAEAHAAATWASYERLWHAWANAGATRPNPGRAPSS